MSSRGTAQTSHLRKSDVRSAISDTGSGSCDGTDADGARGMRALEGMGSYEIASD